MKIYHFLLIILMLPFLSSCQNKAYTITPVKPFFSVESSPIGKNKFQYFIISNFNNNMNIMPDSIKAFVLKSLDSDYYEYDNYIVQCYEGNSEFLKTHINDKHSDINLLGDFVVFNFFWKKGIFFGYQQFNKGDLIKSKYD